MTSSNDTETCACCGRIGQYETKDHGGFGLPEGWVTFESESTLIVDVPEDDFVLPFEVVEAIRGFEGLVRLERVGPEIQVASVREVVGHLAGMVCPDCLAKHEDWEFYEWLWFLSGVAPEGGAS